MAESEMVVVKFDYKAASDCELNIHKDEKLYLLDSTSHWWQVMNFQGQKGYVPKNHVKKTKTGFFSSLRRFTKKSREPSILSPNTPGGERGMDGLFSPPPPSQQQQALSFSSSSTPPSSLLTNDHQNKSLTQIINDSIEGGGVGGDVVDSHEKIPPIVGERSGSQENNNDFHHPHHLHHNFHPTDSQVGMSIITTNNTTATANSSSSAGGKEAIGNNNIINNEIQTEYCVAKFPYQSNHADELTLETGDEIHVLQKCSDSWWFGRLINVTDNSTSATAQTQQLRPLIEGWFPSNYTEPLLEPTTSITTTSNNSSIINNNNNNHLDQMQSSASVSPLVSDSQNYPPSPNNNGSGLLSTGTSATSTTAGAAAIRSRLAIVRTLYAFSRNQTSELSFEAGEILEIIDKPIDDPEWWLARNSRREEGLVPVNYIAIIQPDAIAVPVSMSASSSSITTTSATAGGGGLSVAGGGGIPILAMTGEELRNSYNVNGLYLDKTWYWGAVSRIDCETMLKSLAAPGHYVVRDSETHPGSLTVTTFTGTRCRNFKVVVESGKYHIGQKEFETMENLLDFYSRNPIYKSNDETHCLVVPFLHPGSTALNNTAPRPF